MNTINKPDGPVHKLEVWRLSTELNIKLLPEIRKMNFYPIQDQLSRSLLSIPSNISEGFGRYSDRDFIRFLRIALGSAHEAETQLYIAIESGFLSNDFAFAYTEIKKIRSMIYNLIKSIQKRL